MKTVSTVPEKNDLAYSDPLLMGEGGKPIYGNVGKIYCVYVRGLCFCSAVCV